MFFFSVPRHYLLGNDVKILKRQQDKNKNKTKTKQSKTKQTKTKQNKTKQNKTKQNKTKQNKTKRNKTKQNKKQEILIIKVVLCNLSILFRSFHILLLIRVECPEDFNPQDTQVLKYLAELIIIIIFIYRFYVVLYPKRHL